MFMFDIHSSVFVMLCSLADAFQWMFAQRELKTSEHGLDDEFDFSLSQFVGVYGASRNVFLPARTP